MQDIIHNFDQHPSIEANPTLIRIQKNFKRLFRTTIILILFLICICVYIFHFASTNTDALCALRNESQSRVEQSEKFLQENPKGIPGVSRAQFNRSIENSKTTVKALSGLDCK